MTQLGQVEAVTLKNVMPSDGLDQSEKKRVQKDFHPNDLLPKGLRYITAILNIYEGVNLKETIRYRPKYFQYFDNLLTPKIV